MRRDDGLFTCELRRRRKVPVGDLDLLGTPGVLSLLLRRRIDFGFSGVGDSRSSNSSETQPNSPSLSILLLLSSRLLLRVCRDDMKDLEETFR